MKFHTTHQIIFIIYKNLKVNNLKQDFKKEKIQNNSIENLEFRNQKNI